MQELELFPTKIYSGYMKDYHSYKDDLIDYIMRYSKNNPSLNYSNQIGYQSGHFLFKEESFQKYGGIIFDNLRPYMIKKVNEFNLYGNVINLMISNLWFNINYPGSFNLEHTHPHSILSGVIWIKCPEKSGNLVLLDPSKHFLYGHSPTEYEFVPEEGKILVFPSHISHRVNCNNSTEDRISISFNITFA